MIKQEVFDWQGRSLTKTYSDCGMLVRNIETGETYGEAVDPTDMHRQYEEVENPEQEEDISAEEALEIITGGAADEES